MKCKFTLVNLPNMKILTYRVLGTSILKNKKIVTQSKY